MKRAAIFVTLLAVSLTGCATYGYEGGYDGGYVDEPYYEGPDYVAPGPVYYGVGGGYYRPGYPYYYRHNGGYYPRPGAGRGPHPWTGSKRPYVQPGGRPGLQGQTNFHPNRGQNFRPGQRPIRRYE